MRTKDRLEMLIRQGWRIYKKSDFDPDIPTFMMKEMTEELLDRVFEEDDDYIYIKDRKLHEKNNN